MWAFMDDKRVFNSTYQPTLKQWKEICHLHEIQSRLGSVTRESVEKIENDFGRDFSNSLTRVRSESTDQWSAETILPKSKCFGSIFCIDFAFRKFLFDKLFHFLQTFLPFNLVGVVQFDEKPLQL